MIKTKLTAAQATLLEEDVKRFLITLVETRSYSNDEVAACAFCADAFAALVGVRVNRVPITNAIKKHPLYCSGPEENSDYTGHFNIEVVWPGSGEQQPVYLNAHIDTVPMGSDTHLLPARVEGDIIHGLGACDDKGPISSIYTVFWLLSHLNLKLSFDVVGHVVVEEEIGGNGALAITDAVLHRKLTGQASIVLEPTAGSVLPVARCGLWMKIVAHGAAAHTAAISSGAGENALSMLLRALEATRAAHKAYQKECAAHPVRYYEGYTPPFNIGTLHSGDWPAKISPEAVAVVSVAVLPNSTNEIMRERLLAAVEADEQLRGKVELRFVFDRDSCVTDFDDPYVKRFARYVKRYGYSGNIESMKALSDMYFYKVVLGIPCVTFGPGDLMDAHSAHEKVDIKDVLKCAFILADWIQDGNFTEV